MRIASWRVALVLAALPSCKDDGGGGGGSGDATTAGDGTEGDPAITTGEATSDGTSGASADSSTGDGAPVVPDWSFEPVYGAINIDDDDGDGRSDWFQVIFAAEDDHSVIPIPSVPEGSRVRLRLTGDLESLRVWAGSDLAVGSGDGEVIETFAFTPDPTGSELSVVFGSDNVVATLELALDDGAGNELAAAEVELRSSPLILNHHLQPTEHVWVVAVDESWGTNASMVDAFAQALGDKFTAVAGVSYDNDVWIQDELQLATGTGSQGQRADTVIDSIRNRGLDPFPEDELLAPDVNVRTWGEPALVTSWDSFGNLENSPPVEVDGVSYPFGRIYYGRNGNLGINAEIAAALQAQRIQAPVELDTTWLCVGHVDEFSSFLPDPDSPKGFKYVISDVPAAWDLLDGLDPDMPLTRFAADHGYDTVGDILADTALRNLNDDLQADELDPIRTKMIEEFGLEASDIILLPSLFEEIDGCGGTVAALIPGMVNLIVAPLENGETHVFVPDPFFRTDVADQSSDPFIAAFDAILPASLTAHYVDDWDVYHLGLGEVHCGTNMTQTPTSNWWESALHLL